jgi:hypothetical protein
VALEGWCKLTQSIITPRGSVTQGPAGRAELKFNTGFGQDWTGKFSAAQHFVDSEVLRVCEPYIPLLTGMLIMSGILGTEVGSGWVKWIAPYARRQYYSKKPPGRLTGPLRGPFWFQRAMAVHEPGIVTGAKALFR